MQQRQSHLMHVASVIAPNVPLQLEEKVEEAELKEENEEAELAGPGPAAPNPFEVFSLLTELCDETAIAELKLRVGKFSLHVKRDVGAHKRAAATAAPMAPPVPGYPMMEVAAMAAPAPPLAAAAPAPAGKPAQGRAYDSEEEGVDEGLLYVVAPKVGTFRRGRFFKGKRGKHMVNEESVVKPGQIVCYLEQLGTQIGIESEHAGEVVRFCVEDGDPVGYGEHLIQIRPSFPGIKKLDRD